LSLCPAIFDRDVLALGKTGFVQALAECGDDMGERFSRSAAEKPDDRQLCRLLRPRRERPRSRRAAEKGDEVAALHSITSSASC
jgi:hypothetical protein